MDNGQFTMYKGLLEVVLTFKIRTFYRVRTKATRTLC